MADSDWSPPESDFKSADTAWTPPESDFAPPKQDTAPPETAGRVAGLAARGVATGAAGLPDAITSLADPIGTAASGLSHVIGQKLGIEGQPSEPGQKPTLSDFVHPEKWQQAAEYFATKADLPTPQTPGERIGYRAAQALPYAALSPETPIVGGLSAAAGAAGSQGAAEAGAGPIGQAAAGLVTGSVPAIGAGLAAGARGIVRGGAQGQAEMQGRLADAAGNANLTLGQASGNRAVQYLEGASAKLPGGAPIKSLAGRQAEDLGTHIDDIVNNLSPSTDVSPTVAGTAINQGAETAKNNMRAAESAAFAKRDALVPHQTPTPITNTMSVLNDLATPTPGAEASTGALLSPKITALRDNLTADAAANGATGPENAALPYLGVRQLRTSVGNSIDWGFAPADPVTNGAMKKVYGALSDDLTAGASAVSPEAKEAATSANVLYAANQQKRDFLNGIIDKAGGPEAVYQAATNGTKQGATKIGGVMSALQPDQQNIVRATVLDRLGRATPGAQNAEGSTFSPSTFLTNWSKLDPDAKDAMFGASGNPNTLRSGLDSLTNTISNIRSGTKLQNFSGTGEAVGHGAGLLAAFESLKALAAGDPHVAMSAVAGVAANNVLGRALTNPRVVNWFAKTTKAPMSALPNAVNQLSQMNDPDAHALAQYLQQPQPIARATGGKVQKPDLDTLVNKLIQRWKAAKRETDRGTSKLLKVPDAAIARALDIAGRAI